MLEMTGTMIVKHNCCGFLMESLCYEQLLFGSFTTVVRLEKSWAEEVVIIVSR